ncbi:MAG: ATP-binding protein [Blautia sp.]|nr:ATP-binding protein [Blautia sp.]
MNTQILDFLEQNTLEMSISFDAHGIITHSNDAARLALQYFDGLNGMHISELMPGNFKQTSDGFETDIPFGDAKQPVMLYRQNKTCFHVQLRYLHAALPMHEYVCMMEDISNEVFLEKRIQQVQQEAEENIKVKSEFVSNITHELRTPVNGILGHTRALSEEITDPKLLGTLQLIERGCNDMNSLINNILDFSKLEAGKFVLENREFNFREMIDYVKANHNPKIIEKGLQLFVTISQEIPERIIGDELRIVQILNNLLSNACKFTSMGKVSLEVLMTAHKQNRLELFFIVHDTGIGIDKADMDKLFKSFSQVDASVSRKYGGTGLGLNISKQLVTLMGGTINVESEKNKGTSFTFSVWVDVPEDEVETLSVNVDERSFSYLEEEPSEEERYQFGSEENKKELEDKMSKLVLAVEMDNWEKAETFMEVVRQLTGSAPQEVRSAVLRLKMAVQKSDYDKTISTHQKLSEILFS